MKGALPAVLLALISLTTPAAAAPHIALLPVEGSPALAQDLQENIIPALATRGYEVFFPPQELQDHLAQSSEVSAALTRVHAFLEQAKKSTHLMNREDAVDAAREAISELKAIHAQYHAPELFIRAYNSLALALLLKPANEAGALQAFIAAFETDPQFRPDPDRTPPRALRLIQQARKVDRQRRPPDINTLQTLARQADVDLLVWLSAKEDNDHISLELLIYSAQARGVSTHLQKKMPRGQLLQEATNALAQGLEKHRAVSPLPRLHPKAPSWYQQWWVWAIAGTVVASTGLIIGLVLQGSDDPPPDNPPPIVPPPYVPLPNYVFRW